MCGIAGIFDRHQTPDQARLEAMGAPMSRRGPDAFGWAVHGDIGLAHRRLSVIDVEGGDQPIYNEDRTLAIVFNGEIYDYQALRAELIERGHSFTTHSDTEVLLHLYEERGPGMVTALNGMFAFAICHLDSGRIFMARDRLGQKPFFYATAPGRFAFASGPASLRALPWVDAALDPEAVHDYLEYTYVPTPRSIHRGIAKLPPAHSAIWAPGAAGGDGELTVERWWRPQLTGDYAGSYAEAQEELRVALDRAVRRRLVADVPLGLFLSGGLDSSLICAIAQRAMDRPAQTFSIGFPDKAYDEREHAAHVAKHLGTEHHFLEVRPDDFGHLESLVGEFEEPFADSSMLPTSLLSRFARQRVTVALSGDAADELFGGYYRYRVMHLSRWLDHVPLALRRGLRNAVHGVLPVPEHERTMVGRVRRLADFGAHGGGLARYLRLIGRFPEDRRRPFYGDALATTSGQSSVTVLEAIDAASRAAKPVDRLMELELQTYLNDDILVKVDRASMAHGLEVRSPFLDPDLVALALRLPYAWKQQGKTRKRILAESFAELLPQHIPGRAKMGFGVPVAGWLRDPWRDPVHDLLPAGRLVQDGWLQAAPLQSMLAEHQDGRADHSYPIFALLVLELWLRGQGR